METSRAAWIPTVVNDDGQQLQLLAATEPGPRFPQGHVVGKRAPQAFSALENVRAQIGTAFSTRGARNAVSAGSRCRPVCAAIASAAPKKRATRTGSPRALAMPAQMSRTLWVPVSGAYAPLDFDHLEDHRARRFRLAAQQRRDREVEQDDRGRLFVAAPAGERQRFLVAGFSLVEPADRAQALAAVRRAQPEARRRSCFR
jgi:hypothetical protein